MIKHREFSHRRKGNGFKLKEGKLNLYQKEIPVKVVVRHWNSLSREVVDDPSLLVSKAMLDGAIGSLMFGCSSAHGRVGTG